MGVFVLRECIVQDPIDLVLPFLDHINLYYEVSEEELGLLLGEEMLVK